MTIKSIAVLLTAVLLLSLSGCGHQDKTTAASLKISKCVEELNSIRGVAALHKSRNKSDQPIQKPFEGLELALTINEMVTSQADPEANVDDLCYTQDTRENFDKLVKALADNDMPATVCFIEGRSFDSALETEWLKRGNLLGNLTFDRRSAKKGDERELVENAARNDHLLVSLWQSFPPKRKFFRHPHPKAISDAGDRALITAYLKKNGYVEVPATIESPDPLFSEMYCGALAKGNTECANLIKANFFPLLLDRILKARVETRDAAGREIKHVLAIRASQLTCDTLAEMLVWFRGLGAQFISLDDALNDPFYAGGSAPNRAAPDTPARKE